MCRILVFFIFHFIIRSIFVFKRDFFISVWASKDFLTPGNLQLCLTEWVTRIENEEPSGRQQGQLPDVWPAKSDRNPYLEGLHTWFNAVLTSYWKYQYFWKKKLCIFIFIGSHELLASHGRQTYKVAHRDLLVVIPCIIPSPLAWAGPSDWPPIRTQSNEISLPRLVHKDTMASILWFPPPTISLTHWLLY